MAIPACDVAMTTALDSTTGELTSGTTEEKVAGILKATYAYFFNHTEVGRRISEDYVFDENLEARIASEFARRFGVKGQIGKNWPGVILSGRLEEVCGDLLAIQDPALTLKHQLIVTASVERARDARGRFIDSVGQEVIDDINGDTSTNEIKEKLRTSPEYRKAWDKAHEWVDPNPSKKIGSISDELRAFSFAYNSATSASLKMISGLITVDGRQYNREQFDTMMEKAVAAKLIRGFGI